MAGWGQAAGTAPSRPYRRIPYPLSFFLRLIERSQVGATIGIALVEIYELP